MHTSVVCKGNLAIHTVGQKLTTRGSDRKVLIKQRDRKEEAEREVGDLVGSGTDIQNVEDELAERGASLQAEGGRASLWLAIVGRGSGRHAMRGRQMGGRYLG